MDKLVPLTVVADEVFAKLMQDPSFVQMTFRKKIKSPSVRKHIVVQGSKGE